MDKRIQVRASEDLIKVLDRLCREHGLDRSAMIRLLIMSADRVRGQPQTADAAADGGGGTTTPPHGDH